jgi:hypothetical protein
MPSSSDRVKEAIRHVLDTGSSLSKMSRRELEETARTLMKSATPTKEKIEDAIEELRAQSRRGADFVSGKVHDELADLLERVAGVFGDFIGREHGAEGAKAAAPATKAPAKTASPKKSPAKKAAAPKKSPAKKAAPKKSPVKKAAVPKKSPTKKSPAKKSPAKKASPTRRASGGGASRP